MWLLAKIRSVVAWVAFAAVTWWAGSFVGILGLRTCGVRDLNAPPDWIDSVVGIIAILAPALATLFVKMRLLANVRRRVVQPAVETCDST